MYSIEEAKKGLDAESLEAVSERKEIIVDDGLTSSLEQQQLNKMEWQRCNYNDVKDEEWYKNAAKPTTTFYDHANSPLGIFLFFRI